MRKVTKRSKINTALFYVCRGFNTPALLKVDLLLFFSAEFVGGMEVRMFYYGYGYYDLLYFVLIILAIVVFISGVHFRSTFNKYSKIPGSTGMSGADCAYRLLCSAGLSNIPIKCGGEKYLNYYDYGNKVLCLSQEVFYGTSIAAIGTAAHEVGHAIQDAEGYKPFKLSASISRFAYFGSTYGVWIVFAGLIFMSFARSTVVLDIGIIVFAISVFYHLVTVPIEFDASKRALHLCDTYGLLGEDGQKGATKVLKAAAFTYVSSAAYSLFTLLRLLFLRGSSSRR